MISKRWTLDTSAHPPPEVPEESGWLLKDGSHGILWYEGDSLPSILDMVCDNDDEEEIFSEDDSNYIYFIIINNWNILQKQLNNIKTS